MYSTRFVAHNVYFQNISSGDRPNTRGESRERNRKTDEAQKGQIKENIAHKYQKLRFQSRQARISPDRSRLFPVKGYWITQALSSGQTAEGDADVDRMQMIQSGDAIDERRIE